MARTHNRGRRERLQRKWDGKLTGRERDAEDAPPSDDELRKLRPDKAWLRANRGQEDD